MDPRDRKWEDRADRQYSNFTNRPKWTAFKWLMGIIAVCVVIGIIFGLVSWISSWGSEAARVTGVENTRTQAFALRDDYRSLEATAGNACDAKSSTHSKDDPTLVEKPDFAYRAKYRDIARDYNRRMDNAFEAGWVRHYPFLNDLPREAPGLTQMQAQVC